jgi:hypothetical protein
MKLWLAAATAVSLLGTTGAQAQIKGLTAQAVAGVARTHVLDLRLSEQRGRQPPTLMRGMIVQHGITPNAFVGVGLANIYAKRNGTDYRAGERPSRSRKPAVTFVFKF